MPTSIRYIKLGRNGAWEAASLDEGRIEWGNANDPHELALAGDWEGADRHYRAMGLSPGTATKYLNDLKALYTADSDALWVTFARGYLWWAFAAAGVTIRGSDTPTHGAAYRATIGPWHNCDANGRPLVMNELSSALTKVASYRQTICNVAASDYLLRQINAEPDPALAAALEARARLHSSVIPLIQELHQDDFELFVDLLFSRLGWRRISRLGGTMKDIDMLLELPATGTRASVQVKSAADQSMVADCANRFAEGSPADAFYFVTHSPQSALNAPDCSPPFDIWTEHDLAEKAITTGAIDWLLNRA